MTVRQRVGVLCVALLTAGWVGAAPALGAPAWTASSILSRPGTRASEPAVAMSADGRMLAAWVAVCGEVEIEEGAPQGISAGYGRIEARLGSRAHGWRGAQVLSSDGETPIAATGANGTAAVAWCARPSSYRSLYVSIAGPGRRFGPAVRVSTSGRYAANCPQALEVQPDGTVVLLYSQTLEHDLTPIKRRVLFALLRVQRASAGDRHDLRRGL